MANEVVRGGVGNFAVQIETSLGIGAAAYRGIYLDEIPTMPTNSRVLVENATKGFRHPLTRIKPEPVETSRESSLRFKQRIRRALADDSQPNIATFLESAGWKVDVGNATTTTAGGGDQTTQLITVASAASMAVGEAILAEVDEGLFKPVLIGALAGAAITPSIALSSACGASEIVEVMHTMTPTTLTGYQVPSNKTLTFRYNSLGYFNDAIGDLAGVFAGCALADIGELEIGGIGTFPTLDMGFHVGDVSVEENDIAADIHYDSSHFAVINSDCELAFATYNAGTPIAALVAKCVRGVKINFGVKTIPIPCVGGGGLNGIQGYLLVQEAPTVTFDALFRGDATFDKSFFTELEGDNTSKYFHFIQPTRDLTHPAFGIWMPNIHLKAGSEPTIDFSGDMISCSATFESSLSNWGGASTDIDELAASPIYFAISGETA
jgi:hypothetical protein